MAFCSAPLGLTFPSSFRIPLVFRTSLHTTNSPRVFHAHRFHHASMCRSGESLLESSASDKATVRQHTGPHVLTTVPENSVFIEKLEVGQKLRGSVSHIGGASSMWLNLNVLRSAKKGTFRYVRGRLQLPVRKDQTRSGDLASDVGDVFEPPPEEVGDMVSVFVKRVDIDAGRLEVTRTPRRGNRITSKRSRRKLTREVVHDGILLDDLQTGQELAGAIVKLGHFGALVDCQVVRKGANNALYRALGLLKRKRFPDSWQSEADLVKLDKVDRTLRVGDSVSVYVREAHVANGFLWLGAEPLTRDNLKEEQRTSLRRARRRWRLKGPETLALGEERVGFVRNMVKFGVFVDIGISTDVLLHYTNMNLSGPGNWHSYFEIGTNVVVRVVKASGRRVGVELVQIEPKPGEDHMEMHDDNPLARPSQVSSVNKTLAETRNVPETANEEKRGAPPTKKVKDTPDSYEEAFSDEYLEDKYGF